MVVSSTQETGRSLPDEATSELKQSQYHINTKNGDVSETLDGLDRMMEVVEDPEAEMKRLQQAVEGVVAASEVVLKEGDVRTAFNLLLKVERELEVFDEELDNVNPVNRQNRKFKRNVNEAVTKEDIELARRMSSIPSSRSLTEDQISELASELVESEKSDFSRIQELLDVLRATRHLVPVEVEAAAIGVLDVGLHLGGRAMVAGRPALHLAKEGSWALLDQASRYVPDDVSVWATEGERRATQTSEYLGPRLAELGETVARLQERFGETAGEAADQVSDYWMWHRLQSLTHRWSLPCRHCSKISRRPCCWPGAASHLRGFDHVFSFREATAPLVNRAGQELHPLVEAVLEVSGPVAEELKGQVGSLVEEGRIKVAELGKPITHKVGLLSIPFLMIN